MTLYKDTDATPQKVVSTFNNQISKFLDNITLNIHAKSSKGKEVWRENVRSQKGKQNDC